MAPVLSRIRLALAPYGAYLHTGPPAFLLQRFPAVPKALLQAVQNIRQDCSRIPQSLAPTPWALKASAFRLHDNAQFHENSSFELFLVFMIEPFSIDGENPLRVLWHVPEEKAGFNPL